MKRMRMIIGYLVGVILVASGAAHSLLGWKQISAALNKAQTPLDLQTGLEIGWHFAGVAMLLFGFNTLFLFTQILKNRSPSLIPIFSVALVYVIFGLWALFTSGMNPFFLIFIIPGLLLAVASWPGVPA